MSRKNRYLHYSPKKALTFLLEHEALFDIQTISIPKKIEVKIFGNEPNNKPERSLIILENFLIIRESYKATDDQKHSREPSPTIYTWHVWEMEKKEVT